MNFLITGGAGFIGINSAAYFAQKGHTITIFDNFSRQGGESNLSWLNSQVDPSLIHIIRADVRDADAINTAVQQTTPDVLLHLAGQVAVTTSVHNPREDFEINALGTFNILEAVRQFSPHTAVLYASTNKVYGGMEAVAVVEQATRYAYRDYPQGIPETYPLDFHSPYGCSKGAGDQYTLDYARIYGLRTAVLRQSCIYGPRQFGVEDQGWVAHFIIAAVLDRPLSIYGDGKQVRDLLHVYDLVRAYEQVADQIDAVSGQAFNLGGGPDNTLSIWAEFGDILAAQHGRDIAITYGDWRPGDQRVFVANIAKAREHLGWQPTISPAEGIRQLYEWVASNATLF
jgi:CDP-paratose 2-epimerase